MELLSSLRRGNLLFQNRTIYLFYYHESHGKVKYKEHLHLKPVSHCLILKSLMAIVLTNVIRCDSCLLRSHPIFCSHCPTDWIRFLFYLSHNAFRTMIEMNNRMRSIRSSLHTSNSFRLHPILENRIRSSDCALPLPDFPSDFPSDPSNHQIIWQWDAGLRCLVQVGPG